MARMLRLDYQKLPVEETVISGAELVWMKSLKERASGKPFNLEIPCLKCHLVLDV